MTLLLSNTDVTDLLDLKSAIEVTRQVLREQAEDTAVALPPRHVEVRRGGALRIVSGALLGMNRMGLRAGPAAALASSRGTGLLWDAETGALLCIMSYPFGTLRTGANVGLATDLFARPDVEEVAMIGTGRNALSLVEAVCAVRSVKKVRVYSRTQERREAWAQDAQAKLGRPVEATPDSMTATHGAGVICVSTDSAAPAVGPENVDPGTFIAAMGRPSEIDSAVYKAAGLVVVGQKKHEEEYFDTSRYHHRLLDLVKTGEVQWDDVAELCDVVVGRRSGRTSPQEIIVFKESQGGFGDIGFMEHVYQEALARGVGQQADVQ